MPRHISRISTSRAKLNPDVAPPGRRTVQGGARTEAAQRALDPRPTGGVGRTLASERRRRRESSDDRRSIGMDRGPVAKLPARCLVRLLVAPAILILLAASARRRGRRSMSGRRRERLGARARSGSRWARPTSPISKHRRSHPSAASAGAGGATSPPALSRHRVPRCSGQRARKPVRRPSPPADASPAIW